MPYQTIRLAWNLREAGCSSLTESSFNRQDSEDAADVLELWNGRLAKLSVHIGP